MQEQALYTRKLRHVIEVHVHQKLSETVTRHVCQDYIELAEDERHSPGDKAAYELRRQTIERVFAEVKEKYGMQHTRHRS